MNYKFKIKILKIMKYKLYILSFVGLHSLGKKYLNRLNGLHLRNLCFFNFKSKRVYNTVLAVFILLREILFQTEIFKLFNFYYHCRIETRELLYLNQHRVFPKLCCPGKPQKTDRLQQTPIYTIRHYTVFRQRLLLRKSQ